VTFVIFAVRIYLNCIVFRNESTLARHF